ncbi:MAG: BCAM0308 family protein [Alphaproteobacteria bacterium]|nr:BCAM0308 family protein [Alphaproteobacteria bacterium]
MKTRDLSSGAPRQDRRLEERVHDPYKTRLKLSDPAVCPECGAAYDSDRWHWQEPRPGAVEVLCQACHRIQDNYPAGELTLGGAFLWQHKSDILNLARNQEALEKGEHPLHRIMAIEERSEDGTILITTTDIHTPRRIGQAVQSAHKGELDFSYDEAGYFLRASWTRDG